MKTKLLISILGLMPALAMAEVNISADPISGRSVPSAPTPVYGETPRGVEYTRTVTAPGASTLDVTGPDGGYLTKTVTSPGNSKTEIQSGVGNNGDLLVKTKSGTPGDEFIQKDWFGREGVITSSKKRDAETREKKASYVKEVLEPGPRPPIPPPISKSSSSSD